MYKSAGLVPSRFLVLIAHFTICVNLLWNSNESLKSCSMGQLHASGPTSPHHLTEFKTGLSVAVGLMCMEFLAFIFGFTMFNSASALLSIFCHSTACLTLTHFIMDGWQCGWFWWIFTWGSVLPIVYDSASVAYVLRKRTWDTSIARPGWTSLLVLAGVITVLGSSTPVGYNIGVINTPGWVIKQFCNESAIVRYNLKLTVTALNILWSSIVSVFLIGGTIGSLSGSLVADRIGRRGGLILASLLGVVAGIFFWTAKGANSVEMLLIGRIVGGLSAGLITTIMPMYLMELAPPRLKGAVGALCPFGVTLGILVGQILSMSKILGNETSWHHCLAMSAVLQAACALLIPALPESPKYLYVIKKKPHLALKELKRIRNVNEGTLSDEIEMLRVEDRENVRQGDNWNVKKVLGSRELFLPLLLVCSLQAGQQLSGVNAVFYYSAEIFRQAGLSTASSELATIGAGCCNILMALLSVLTMSLFNRRTILQMSLVSSAAFLVVLGLSISLMKTFLWMPYLCIVGVLGYVLCYGLGLGPIPYFVGSELFEVGPRSSAMALGSMANWAGNFIVGQTFPTLSYYIGAASFFIFATIVVGLLLFVRAFLPETKGKDACEIYHLVRHGFKSKPLLANNVNNELNNLAQKANGL